MVFPHLFTKIIDDIGQYHDLSGEKRISGLKGGLHHVHRLGGGGLCHCQFHMGLVGEVHSLLIQFPEGMGHVHGIVGDPFDIRDGVKHQGCLLILLLVQFMAEDLHEIVAQLILIGIALVLHPLHL